MSPVLPAGAAPTAGVAGPGTADGESAAATGPRGRARAAGVTALPRVLGAWSAAGVMLGLIVGSGIFRVPSSVADQVQSVGGIALVWTLGGVVALCGALTLAELAALFPEPGGEYVFLREGYGLLPAFLYGWTRLLLLVPASLGAMSLIFASYLGTVLPVGAGGEKTIAAALLLALAALNYRSLRWSAALQNAVTLAKVVALALVVAAAFLWGGGTGGAFAAAPSFHPASWSGLGLALVTVLWAYSGWQSVAALGGEIRDPARVVPRVLAGGMTLVVLVYLAVNAAYLRVLPVPELAASSMVAADAATRAFGPGGARVVAALVALATFGAVQASLMFNPRIFYAMARDGVLFAPVARVHERFFTPHVATLFTAALGIAYLSVRSFEQLAQAFILGVWPFHAATVWAVFRLRRSRPDLPRPFRTPGYPVVPALFLVASAALLGNALVQEPGLTLFGFGLIATGLPAYALARRRLTSQTRDPG